MALIVLREAVQYFYITMKPMIIDIAGNTSVGQIKHQFTTMFPYLKLEFFYEDKNEKPQLLIASNDTLLSKLQPKLREGVIVVDEHLIVADLEAQFKEEFLLNVQVFRRSGSLWLETTITDIWTLGRQNQHGLEITESFYNRGHDNYNLDLVSDSV